MKVVWVNSQPLHPDGRAWFKPGTSVSVTGSVIEGWEVNVYGSPTATVVHYRESEHKTWQGMIDSRPRHSDPETGGPK